jgi:hypothetical protein
MSSGLEQFELPNKASKKKPIQKFERSSLYTDASIPEQPSYTTINDWSTFSDYIKKSEDRKDRAEKLDKERRAKGEKVAANTLTISDYDFEGTEKLGELIGKLNVGVKYRPDWVAEPSANIWLNNELEKAKKKGNEKEVARLQKWGIKTADLDDDEETPDNVIVFSDIEQGKIKAVDGYQLVPGVRKDVQRAFYSKLPDRVARQQTTPEVKKLYKQYYRKYPTPILQEGHPIQEFTPPSPTVFQNIRARMGKILNMIGIGIKSKANPNGTMTAQHYLPIIQKLSTALYHNIVRKMFNLGVNYDWKEDPRHIKSKSIQKKIIENMEKLKDNRTYWNRFTSLDDTKEVIKYIIEDTVDKINQAADGEQVIVLTWGQFNNPITGEKTLSYDVKDLHVLNEQAIKDAKKGKGYTREMLADLPKKGSGVKVKSGSIKPSVRPSGSTSVTKTGMDVEDDPFDDDEE